MTLMEKWTLNLVYSWSWWKANTFF